MRKLINWKQAVASQLLVSSTYATFLRSCKQLMCTWIAETCMTARNKHNLSSWVNPTNIISQQLSDGDEAEDTGTTDAVDAWELALFVESSCTLSSQLYSSVSEFSSLIVSGMSEQWLTSNRNWSFEYRPLEYCVCRCSSDGAVEVFEFSDAAAV